MAETLPLEKLEENVSSIYEAIVIIARRARQINDVHKRLIDAELSTDEEEETIDESLNRDIVESKYLKLPKPTTLAMDEMLSGKLVHEYIKKEE